MIVCIAIQISDPYIPFYSIGCLIGVAILDSFSVSDTKEKIKAELEKESSIKEEKEHELDKAITIAYKDALTNVNSRYAFVKKEVSIDERIEKQEIDNFAVIVFDINGLKSVNDRFGHQKGDELIIDSATLICDFFPEESIYRYGGDEFVAVLEGEIVKEAQIRHDGFMKMIEHNIKNNKTSISSGISFFDKENDYAFKSAFYRADRMMYERKQFLKSLR
jgi:diguanylate cyclase (GGDEF)-like protein